MSRIARISAFALLSAALLAPVSAQERAGNTLWIGNSLVRFGADGPYPSYDVPEIVESMRAAAASGGRSVRGRGNVRVLASDGMGMVSWWRSWHGYTAPDGENVSAARAIVEDPRARRRYDARLGYEPLPAGSGGWDRIVCLSLMNYLDEDQHWYGGREIVPATERWYRFIREKQPGAEILHYVAPADSRKMARRQARVDALYEELRERHGGRLVPVGRAFRDAMRARPRLELRRPREDDFLHYSGAGAYLASAVFYAVLYGDPVGLPAPPELGVTSEDARFLAAVARDVVREAGSAPR